MKKQLNEQSYRVEGMACDGCAEAVQEALEQLNGIRKADVSLENESVNLKYDAEQVTDSTMAEAVIEAGYKLVT